MSSALPLQLPVLHTLSALTLTGVDAHTYLQGQLSNDLRKLNSAQALLASCNSAQGRVQAVLTLIERPIAEGKQIIALLPPTMRGRIVPRLKNYILRAKVQLLDDPSLWSIAPLSATHAKALFQDLPAQPGAVLHLDNLTLMRWWSQDERYLLLAPATAIHAQETHDNPDGSEVCLLWRQADIAAGLPQVFPETYESFVAQMLNLDALNGISFNKGCYTGQEIIARTHYRGTIKRRMLRYRADCAAPVPGTRIVSGDHPAGEVVDSVDHATGCELLAVMSLDQANQPLRLDGVEHASLQALTLPYDLPSKATAEAASS